MPSICRDAPLLHFAGRASLAGRRGSDATKHPGLFLNIPHKVRLAAALLLFPITVAALADGLPAPFEATYEGAKFPFSARATIGLQRMGDYYRYEMRATVHATVFKWTDIYDCSLMRIEEEQFYPIAYVHRDSRDADHNRQARFDRERHAVDLRRGSVGAQVIENVPKDAWDLLSVQMRLRADVANAAPGAELTYDVVEKDEIKARRLKVGGRDEAWLNGQTMGVVKAESIGREAKHRHEFWFAADYAWLPVRVSVGGVTLDLVSPPKDAARVSAPSADSPPRCE